MKNYKTKRQTRAIEGCSAEDEDCYETAYLVYDADTGELLLETTDEEYFEQFIAECSVEIAVYNSIGCEIAHNTYYGSSPWNCMQKFTDDYIADEGDSIKIVKIVEEDY